MVSASPAVECVTARGYRRPVKCVSLSRAAQTALGEGLLGSNWKQPVVYLDVVSWHLPWARVEN